MKWHPGVSMMWIWVLCALAFAIMPFQIETRTVTAYGFVLLIFFIATFVAGSFLATPALPARKQPFTKQLDLQLADRIILIATIISVLALLIDIASGDVLNLESAFQDRDDRSVGVLRGNDTGGTVFFQLAFLTYPMGYVALVRETVFPRAINLIRIALFGFLPLVLASLAMGGRGPILYGFIVLAIAFQARRLLYIPKLQKRSGDEQFKRFAMMASLVVGGLVAMNYFVEVFMVRANVVGGVDAMQRISALNWGVSFDGPGSSTLRSLVGDGNSYLIYVFLWYLIQGLIMSNVVFNEYDGGMTLGIYGVDLVSAVVRRADPQYVSNALLPLADINIYGFLPNAFGSIYVDFGFLGFIPIFIWGYLAGIVYRKVKTSNDARWVLISPFVTMGIVFSLINTPLGFGNGLMIHFWLVVIVWAIQPLARRQTMRAAAG